MKSNFTERLLSDPHFPIYTNIYETDFGSVALDDEMALRLSAARLIPLWKRKWSWFMTRDEKKLLQCERDLKSLALEAWSQRCTLKEIRAKQETGS